MPFSRQLTIDEQIHRVRLFIKLDDCEFDGVNDIRSNEFGAKGAEVWFEYGRFGTFPPEVDALRDE